MKLVAIVGLLLSILIAVASVLWVKTWGIGTEQAVGEKPKPKTVVVANDPLKYGERLTYNKLKVVDWFAETVPQGSVGTIEELALTDDGPYVLASISSGSPVLKSQLTAPGQKPSLSSLLAPGTVAVTVPVTTITGVAGFVLPDERVDIISTRAVRNPETNEINKINDIILEDIKVLAADRTLDAEGKPVLAKSVTFQVPREEAQKLVLATQEGEVFLTLRSTDKSGDVSLLRDKNINKETSEQIKEAQENRDTKVLQTQLEPSKNTIEVIKYADKDFSTKVFRCDDRICEADYKK